MKRFIMILADMTHIVAAHASDRKSWKFIVPYSVILDIESRSCTPIGIPIRWPQGTYTIFGIPVEIDVTMPDESAILMAPGVSAFTWGRDEDGEHHIHVTADDFPAGGKAGTITLDSEM